LALVTIDDKKVESAHVALYANGMNVHAFLMPRAEFRKNGGKAQSAIRLLHSLLAKGRLLYTHDETIANLCAKLLEIGERDTQIQLFSAATQALPPIYKGAQMVRHARRFGLHRASGFSTLPHLWPGSK